MEMEVQSDHHGILVVSLDNCITSVGEAPCDVEKAGGCVYAGPEAPMVQITGGFGDIRQTLPRLQPPHLAPLQSIQYSQAVSYNPSQAVTPALYQPLTVSAVPLPLQYTSTPYVPVAPTSPPAQSAVEPTYPAEGFDYFMEIQNYLTTHQYPAGTSDSYNKSLKKRAQNYMMIEGKLFHNRKVPKEVVMRKDEQEDLLSDVHIMKDNGVHLGVKKMFNELRTKYFWRGMYTDVVHFVRKCDKCWEQVVVSRLKRAKHSGESDDSDTAEDPLPLSTRPLSRIWTKVEVQVHGPYNKTSSGNEYVVTATCPESGWCCARAVPASGLPTHLADFLFHSFCNYGFARCFLVDCSPDLRDAVYAEYSGRTRRLGEMFAGATLECMGAEQCSTTWVQPLLLKLVQRFNNKWDKHLDHFLFQYRIGELKELTPKLGASPFSAFFNHDPLGFIVDQDKENTKNNTGYHLRQRRTPSSPLQCKYCSSVFTSKISFCIHQRRHTSQSQHRKQLNNRRHSVKASNDVDSVASQSDMRPCAEWRESSVSAVKALMEATKEERRRRGKYHKYPVELQEQMAAYAAKHGTSQAVKHFSETLGEPVGETTIRNLVKIHSAFTPTVKDEIGKFAAYYGVEPAAKSYSKWLKRDVSMNLVRKFKTIYLSKRPGNMNQQRDKQNQLRKSKVNVESPSKNKKYTTKMKDEIGEYACNHSVQDTVEYFAKKLEVPIKEQTVKKFHKLYIDKCQNKTENEAVNKNTQTQEVEPSNCVNQEAAHFNVYNSFQDVQTVPVTLYQLNQYSPNDNSICYQASSSSIISSQSRGPFNYQTVQNFPSTLPSISISAPPPPSYPMALIKRPDKTTITNFTIPQQSHQAQACLVPQQPVFITQDRTGTPLFPHFMATAQPIQQTILTIIPEKETSTVDSNQDLDNNFTQDSYEQTKPSGSCSLPEQDKEKEPLSGAEVNVVKGTKPPVRTDAGSKKRGTYTVYSPEIRADIGKFAADHGIVKACEHFAKVVGHEVPESTVRGLREKYLAKKKHCEVTSLGFSPRGRPLRLGKYDELVQHCLKDLVRSGEKVSAYLAITTAKQVLNQHEPSLLEENGGSLKLNITWAKSILKRIGVHNNS